MIRKDYIKQVADKKFDEQPPTMDSHFIYGFVNGALWADENPKWNYIEDGVLPPMFNFDNSVKFKTSERVWMAFSYKDVSKEHPFYGIRYNTGRMVQFEDGTTTWVEDEDLGYYTIDKVIAWMALPSLRGDDYRKFNEEHD